METEKEVEKILQELGVKLRKNIQLNWNLLKSLKI